MRGARIFSRMFSSKRNRLKTFLYMYTLGILFLQKFANQKLIYLWKKGRHGTESCFIKKWGSGYYFQFEKLEPKTLRRKSRIFGIQKILPTPFDETSYVISEDQFSLQVNEMRISGSHFQRVHIFISNPIFELSLELLSKFPK